MSLFGSNELDFEDDLVEELGAAPKGKKAKRKERRKKILKKVGKGVAAIATGGLSLAPTVAKKLKKTAVGKKAKAVISGALHAAGSGVASKPAARVLAKVATKTAGDCRNMDELAKLVAAQLVAKLGPPIQEANRALKLAELQREATYEHKRLMTDSEFRRKVLGHLTAKAALGNASCERTIRVIMGG